MTEPVSKGDEIYSRDISKYEVVEILDKTASEVQFSGEIKERGHVIYESRTVAEQFPSYPEDDTVIRVKRLRDGETFLWPISRAATKMDI